MKQPVAGHIDPAGTHTLQVIASANRFNEWMYNTIRPFLKGEILEIGSGIGNISQFAIREGLSITLSDINPEYQQLLIEKFSAYSNVKGVRSMDLQHPSFTEHYQHEKEKYDTVFYLNVIEHLEHDAVAVKNSHFLLKKGGNLIILAPAYNWLYCKIDKELGHYRRYTLKRLSSLFPSSRFSILHQQYFNVPGITGWFLFGKLLRKKQIDSGEMSVFNRLVPLFKLADTLCFKKIGLSAIVIAQKKMRL
jgi:SAM-dependent methyltransferase